MDLVLPGGDLQIVHTAAGNLVEVDLLERLTVFKVVQLGQLDDVIDQGQEPSGIRLNFTGKTCHIGAGGHPIFNQLRIAGNGCQRCLELMGDIRRKVLPHLRRLQDVLMLGPDLVRKGNQLRIGRLHGGSDILRHGVDR